MNANISVITRVLFVFVVLGLAQFAALDAAYAYGGPGSVISGIGALLAAIAAILASIFGFIWFPLKRLYSAMTEEDTSSEDVAPNTSGE